MSKATPGPWKFGKELTSHAGEWLISMDSGSNRGNPIAETRIGTGDESANAKLISSAPDLLEALQRLLELHIAHHHEPEHVKARAAILKATGEPRCPGARQAPA